MSDVDPQEGADNPVEDERPEWLPQNFKSPEDLARSYQEAQRKITELSTTNKGMEESLGYLTSQVETLVAQNAPDPDEVRAQWEQAYESDPWNTIQTVVQQTAEAVRNELAQQNQQPAITPDVTAFIADQNMAQTHEDWGQYKPQVAELVKTDPLFANDSLWSNPALATSALDRAYKMVKAESVLSGDQIVQQQLADTRQMKLNAQSATGAAGRPDSPDANANRWQEIVNAPSGKLEF